MFKQFTLGIEEFQIIDPHTRELRSHVAQILEEGKMLLGEQVKPELIQSMIEVGTGVCKDIKEARSDITNLRGILSGLVRKMGLEIVAASTHPFSHWQDNVGLLVERSIGTCAHIHSFQRRSFASAIFPPALMTQLQCPALIQALVAKVNKLLDQNLNLPAASQNAHRGKQVARGGDRQQFLGHQSRCRGLRPHGVRGGVEAGFDIKSVRPFQATTGAPACPCGNTHMRMSPGNGRQSLTQN